MRLAFGFTSETLEIFVNLENQKLILPVWNANYYKSTVLVSFRKLPLVKMWFYHIETECFGNTFKNVIYNFQNNFHFSFYLCFFSEYILKFLKIQFFFQKIKNFQDFFGQK